ncbi:DUF2059 domain-containing protein [Telluria aromaticivorans]|uniref:DUF2059 domain-containing protein n=1 Tax=Telluria aromaticivorans TaxID=2725995 RepID=A0A7Y2P239_9BURK|nr:DUF2059 domain-containing protein [Telluria aromaticivorans]NNG24524.1 DUF2059 domain-containing protein [Telluria aromaticivorans]
MKKFFVSLAAVATFAALPSFALAAPGADPQTTVAVKAMLDAMEVRKLMTAQFAEMEKAMPAMMRAQLASVVQSDPGMNAEKKQEALAKIDRMLPSVTRAVGKLFRDPTLTDDMIAEMVPLYATHYTVAEIKELTVFYRTSLGRKMLSVTPRLTAESMAVGQRVVTPRLGKLMQDVMQDVQKP